MGVEFIDEPDIDNLGKDYHEGELELSEQHATQRKLMMIDGEDTDDIGNLLKPFSDRLKLKKNGESKIELDVPGDKANALSVLSAVDLRMDEAIAKKDGIADTMIAVAMGEKKDIDGQQFEAMKFIMNKQMPNKIRKAANKAKTMSYEETVTEVSNDDVSNNTKTKKTRKIKMSGETDEENY